MIMNRTSVTRRLSGILSGTVCSDLKLSHFKDNLLKAEMKMFFKLW